MSKKKRKGERERESKGSKYTTYPVADKDLQIERNNYNRRSANIYSRGQPDLSQWQQIVRHRFHRAFTYRVEYDLAAQTSWFS